MDNITFLFCQFNLQTFKVWILFFDFFESIGQIFFHTQNIMYLMNQRQRMKAISIFWMSQSIFVFSIFLADQNFSDSYAKVYF